MIRYGGHIHQLNLYVFEFHHSQLGSFGGEGVVGNLQRCLGDSRNQLRFTHIWWSNQGNLPRSLPGDVVDASSPGSRLCLCGFLGELCNLGPKFSPKPIRALVLGHNGEHLLQGDDPFVQRFGTAIALLCREVLRSEICRHSYCPRFLILSTLPGDEQRKPE
ncbi:MAG: hypothetical protein DDT27_01457 [Dehalococcoidia bacterium]|nr:hypothetical protein [Chloroflexota bacterium]